MRTFSIAAFLLVLCLIGGSVSAEVMLFKGDPLYSSNISVGGWGSGTAVEASDRVLEGSRSIKITTQGLHEGARIDFRNPVEILSEPVDDGDYLQFDFSFTTVALGTSGFGATPGMMGPPGMPGMPGMPQPNPGYYYGMENVPRQTKVNVIRLVIQSADGKSVEATQDVPQNEEDGWYRVSIPFKHMGLKQGDSFRISRVLVFTDVPDTFYLGKIGTIRDNASITASIESDEEVVAIYDVVTLRAEAEGGACALNYSWNFGDNGPDGTDATGNIVTHRYKKAGDYTVKLTVSDGWGMKKPVTSTMQVTVND